MPEPELRQGRNVPLTGLFVGVGCFGAGLAPVSILPLPLFSQFRATGLQRVQLWLVLLATLLLLRMLACVRSAVIGLRIRS
jgi:hypothetical protein